MAETGKWAEDDLVPISALQHLVFCERQFGLIHLEGLWAENRLTVEGRQLHEKVDSAATERRGGVETLFAVPLRSDRMGLVGRADVVEIGAGGEMVPVEYKRGKAKKNDCDRVQLCAQALCLEEAFDRTIGFGFLFYARPRRRLRVTFDPALRAATVAAAKRAHHLIAMGITPHARREPRCEQCSLIDLCLPDAMGRPSAAEYFDRLAAATLAEGG